MRPNADRAVLSLVKWLVDDHVRPGANHVVKHIGDIFAGMFQVALKDIERHGANDFQHVPTDAKKHLMDQFSKMLWKLMQEAAASLHVHLDMASAVICPQLVHRQDLSTSEFYDAAAPWPPLAASHTPAPMPSPVPARVSAPAPAPTPAVSSNNSSSSFDVDKAKVRLRKTIAHQACLGLDGVSHTQDAVRDKALEYLFELLQTMVIPLGEHLFSFVEKVTVEMTKSFNHIASETNWDEVVTPNLVNEQRIEDLTRTVAELERTMKQVEDTVEEAIHSAAAADVDSVTATSAFDAESTILCIR